MKFHARKKLCYFLVKNYNFPVSFWNRDTKGKKFVIILWKAENKKFWNPAKLTRKARRTKNFVPSVVGIASLNGWIDLINGDHLEKLPYLSGWFYLYSILFQRLCLRNPVTVKESHISFHFYVLDLLQSLTIFESLFISSQNLFISLFYSQITKLVFSTGSKQINKVR